MDELFATLDRADATLAINAGRLPEAQCLIDGLIQSIGEPSTTTFIYISCNCLLDRVYFNGTPVRWREQLRDLERAEKQAQFLPTHLRRLILHQVSVWRGQLQASKRSPAYNPLQAWKDWATIRGLGVDSDKADELECELASDGEDWKRAVELADAATKQWEKQGWAQAAAVSRLNACGFRFQLGEFSRAKDELDRA